MASSKHRRKGWSLPDELVEETLKRVPIESLVRFKSICKQWYGLLNDDKRFIQKHLDLSREQPRFIRIRHDVFQIMNPVTLDLLSLPIPDEFRSLDIYRPCSYNVFNFVHCDGLLLCSVSDGRGAIKLAIWNPLLSQIKYVQPLRFYRLTDNYGFGYDKNGTYKILRHFYTPTPSENVSVYEIYDFESKLWRGPFPASTGWCLAAQFSKVPMKGNMYWLAAVKDSRPQMFIQSFDFSTDEFKPFCSSLPFEPHPSYVGGWPPLDIVALSVFEGDRLSLLHQPCKTREIKIDVWVASKVNDELVSWTKFFNVTRPDLPVMHPRQHYSGNPAYFIHKTNGIMLWCDQVVQQEDVDKAVHQEDVDKAVPEGEDHKEEAYACANFYEISQGEIKKQVETGPPYLAAKTRPYVFGCVYVPSLVPVPE